MIVTGMRWVERVLPVNEEIGIGKITRVLQMRVSESEGRSRIPSKWVDVPLGVEEELINAG